MSKTRIKFPSRQNAFPEKVGQQSARMPSIFTSTEAGVRLEDAAIDNTLLMATVLGIDEQPRTMSIDEIAGLGDVFTREILLKGEYPLTLGTLVESIHNIEGGDAYQLRKLFMVAEGGQFNIAKPEFAPNARLAFTWQRGPHLPPDPNVEYRTSTQRPRFITAIDCVE